MVLPTAAASSAAANGGAATLPAAALLTHLTTMRRSVREIFNPHAADAAGALADANSALQAMARLIKYIYIMIVCACVRVIKHCGVRHQCTPVREHG